MADVTTNSASDWYRQEGVLLGALQRGRGRRRLPRIDGYDVLSEVRRGGQGAVFLGKQRSTRRQVAIKVLPDTVFTDPPSRRRFEREIDLVSSLRHPRIVTLFDSGVTVDERPYLVMEYVDGVPLDQWLSAQERALNSGGGPRPRPADVVRERLRLFARICDAVNHAHQRGVIHRDLKPGNILIDREGEPRVLDFGVARPVVRAPGGSDMTATNDFLGTLAYAAPEQLKSDADAVDVRSDVYALGVILYRMLTGEHPYNVAGAPADVIRAVTETQPPQPSTLVRRLADEDPDQTIRRLDHEIDTIVLKALAKDPERRYPTADALRRDVEHYLAGEPIEAKRDSALYVLGKLIRRHRVVAALCVLLLFSIMAFGAAMTVLYERTRAEAERGRAVQLFLEDTLASVRPAVPGHEVTVRETLDEAVHWIEVLLAEQPEIEASIRATIGNSYRAIGRYDDAERQIQQSLDIRRDLFGEESLEVAHALGMLGLLEHDRGDFAQAEALLRHALAIRRALLEPTDADIAYSLTNLARLLRDAGRLDEAERTARESLDIRLTYADSEPADAAMGQFDLAEILFRRGELADAEALHRSALTIRREILHAEHPDIERSLIALATVLLESGRPAQAEPLLRECLSLRERRAGTLDAAGGRAAASVAPRPASAAPADVSRVATARVTGLLGVCLLQQGQFDQAETHLLDAYQILSEIGAASADVNPVIESLIELYEATGDTTEASTWRERWYADD